MHVFVYNVELVLLRRLFNACVQLPVWSVKVNVRFTFHGVHLCYSIYY